MKRALLLAAASAAMIVSPAVADVRAGIEAWQRGDYAAAVKQWEPDAKAGDPDAEFNLGQAYKLGKGVPVDLGKAQIWYKKAADQGHQQALANYGLILFQSGKRTEALPWLTKAADRGEPRAQYVVGTALFNGDFGAKDWPRAYAYMTAAAAAGLPQAATSLGQMDSYVPEADRQKGLQIAQTLGKPTAVVSSLAAARAANTAGPGRAAIGAPPPAPTPPAFADAAPPPIQARRPAPLPRPLAPPPETAMARPQPFPPAATPTPQPEAPPAATPRRVRAAPGPEEQATRARPVKAAPASPPAPAAGGKWRIQLGAYGSPAAANAAWSKVSGRLAGFNRITAPAGAMTRLQTGPFASRAAAAKACGVATGAGLGCIAVPAP